MTGEKLPEIRPKRGQIWQAKKDGRLVEIIGERRSRWYARQLTDKPGVYNGTHTLARRTIWKNYILIK